MICPCGQPIVNVIPELRIPGVNWCCRKCAAQDSPTVRTPALKTCSKCGVAKPRGEYPVSGSRMCKSCKYAYDIATEKRRRMGRAAKVEVMG